jgi:hypothetical protein
MRITPRTANHPRSATGKAQHGRGGSLGDAAAMHQRERRDRGEPPAGLGVIGDRGVPGNAAAGHHDRTADPAQHQQMHRRAGQHEAERGESRRHRTGHVLRAARIQQHERSGRALQQPLLFGGERTVIADHCYIARHQREGAVAAPLARAQPCHGSGVGGVANELPAVGRLDGHDLAVADQPARRIDIVEHGELVEADRRIVEADKPRAGAASVAGDGGMAETPAGRIAIFGAAGFARAGDCGAGNVGRGARL